MKFDNFYREPIGMDTIQGGDFSYDRASLNKQQDRQRDFFCEEFPVLHSPPGELANLGRTLCG
jgi:hypothetical protein